MQLVFFGTLAVLLVLHIEITECKAHRKKGSHHSHHHHKSRRYYSEERHFFRDSSADFTSSDYKSYTNVKPRGEKSKDNYDRKYHHILDESYGFKYNYSDDNMHPKPDFDFKDTRNFPDQLTVAGENDGKYKDLAQLYLPIKVSSNYQQSRTQRNILECNRRKYCVPFNKSKTNNHKRKTKKSRLNLPKDENEKHLRISLLESFNRDDLLVITPKNSKNHYRVISSNLITNNQTQTINTATQMQKDYPKKSNDNLIEEQKITNSKIFSPNSLNKKKVSSLNGSSLRARSLDQENKKYKSANPSRWTLTYRGPASAESSLNNSLVNVTAQVGGDTFLPCKVGHLGDRQISWIRSRDWHVLSSGNTLFTPDSRVSVLHEPGTQDWTLHIRYVTPRDNGTYECQVSTGTGIISIFVNLTVVTPIARIPGRGNYHVNKGSPIVLNCLITRSPVVPRYVFWYQNGKQLNFLRNKPEIRIFLEKVDTNDENFDAGTSAISRLRISSANDYNSGNYTCDAPMTLPASTTVFVTEGDKTAAIQRIDSSSGSRQSSLTKFSSFVNLLTNQSILLLLSRFTLT